VAQWVVDDDLAEKISRTVELLAMNQETTSE